VPQLPRSVRMARQLIAGRKFKDFVPVEELAQEHAVVVQEAMPDDISGMLVPLPSVPNGKKWAIAVNAGHARVRQRFTIAHELGHLLMHRYTSPHADNKFQVRFRDETSSAGSVREEVEANQFAAELLMPEHLIKQAAARFSFDLGDDTTDGAAVAKLTRLAKRLQVSVQALSFRIANLTSLAD
jgi:Zn-dependent peptidase ImmA (M78 family)